MPLAILFEVRYGSVPSRTTRTWPTWAAFPARITPIMNIRNLAPAIQEQLLYLPAGNSPVHERTVRAVVEETCWAGKERASPV